MSIEKFAKSINKKQAAKKREKERRKKEVEQFKEMLHKNINKEEK